MSMNKFFIDTSPFVYYLQQIETYSNITSIFLRKYIDSDFITSSVVIMEYLVFPYRENRKDLSDAFKSFLREMDIKTKSINDKTADIAAKIRAKYKSLKGMDALNLATAIENGCNIFLTNDKQLKQVTEINVVVIDDLK